MRFLKSYWFKIISLLWIIAFLYFISRFYNIDYLKIKDIDPNQILEYIRQFGVLAPIVYIILFVFRPLVLFPATIFVILAGIIFGQFWGSVYAVLGAMLSAALEFFVARYFWREKIVKLIKGRLVYADEAIQRHGFKTVFFIRFIPNVAFDIQNFSLGLTQISFSKYVVATLLGITPAIVLYVYFGYALEDLVSFWKIALGIFVILVTCFFIRYIRKINLDSCKYHRKG